MQVTIEAKTLKNVLPKLRKFGGKGSTLPTLACVKVDCNTTGHARIAATNLDAYLELTIDAELNIDGGTVAVFPLDTLAKFAGRDVTISTHGDSQRIELTSGTLKVKAVNEAEDYPANPMAKQSEYTLAATLNRDTLAKTLAFASTEATRPVLNGVCISQLGSEQTLTATDSYKLITTHWDTVPTLGRDWTLILPSSPALALLSCLPKAADHVDLFVKEDNPEQISGLALAAGGMQLAVRPVEGIFPEWRRLMPTDEQPIEFNADQAALLDALDTIQPFTKRPDRSRYASNSWSEAIEVAFGDSELVISPHQDTDTSITVPAEITLRDMREKKEGPLPRPRPAGFNLGYLRLAIAATSGHYRGEGRTGQAVFNGGATTALVMPLRLKD